MTTSNDPEAIRRQIEQTQRELSYDVDALNEKVNPSRVMDRRVSAAKGRFSRARERVMGSAHETRATAQYRTQNAAGTVQDKAQGAAESAQDAAQQAAHAVQQAPDTIIRQAQGNPLAAGLVAFGLGWLVSSLIPASQKEQEVAAQVKDRAGDLAQPLQEQGRQLAENLREPAQQAVQQVKDTASDAASTTADHAQSAAGDVKDTVQNS
jgi:ElaB/YqjD/DUF883 family membrane-anchored ribosome-binding protein